ncbi:uncharacterized protein BDV17DRAFT_291938 [Aspergillus undulatus]|uniref:uncharacterized protein n=1 Tax=Aspergillus undulatus TaxID=1810928 RepID=UPI003CCD2B7C
MPLDALPGELIALVLQSCDSFYTLRDMILTSKTLYTVWKCNQRIILWDVGQAAIPGFTDALIAVRATTISKDSILAGDLPPHPFPTSTLSGDAIKPTLAEIQHIQSFAKLARYLEHRTRDPSNKDRAFLPHRWYFDSLSWESQTWSIWRENYHRTVYRYLTAGAVLCRAYYEPLVSDRKPQGALSSLLSILEGIAGRDSESEYPAWYTEEEKRYLATIPLYDCRMYEQWGSAFEALEEIFIQESGKQSQAQQTGDIYKPQPSEGLGATFFKTFTPKHAPTNSKHPNPHPLNPTHSETLFTSLLQFLHLIDGDIRCFISLPGDTPVENPSHPVQHSLSVFLFGSFTFMDVNIRQCNNPLSGGAHCQCLSAFARTSLPDLTSHSLATSDPNPSGSGTGSSNTNMDMKYLAFPSMHNHLKKIHDASGIPNCYGHPILKTPPPSSFFIEYMMRKYFGLRFSAYMFDATVEVRAAWFAFHQAGGVFTGYAPRDGPEGKGGYVGNDLLVRDTETQGDWPVPVFDEDAWYY